MVNKNGRVGDFKNVPILEISKISIRTKLDSGKSNIAISNKSDKDHLDADSDVLENIDMLIVGDEKALRWLAELLIDQADLLKNSNNCFKGETLRPHNKTDS
jgi:hypothetical protein